jgi:purine-binding chemotaxis protein CheW
MHNAQSKPVAQQPAATGAVARTVRQVEVKISAGRAGQPVVYKVAVRPRSAGPLLDLRVSHRVPPGMCFVRAEPAPKIAGDQLLWEFGNVPAGHLCRIKVVVRPLPDAEPAPATTTFQISYVQGRRHTTPVLPQLQLRWLEPGQCSVGRPLDFGLEIGNAGAGEATNVVVAVTLPLDVSLVETPPGGTWDPTARTVLWRLDSLPSTVTQVVKFQARADLPMETHLTAAAHAETATGTVADLPVAIDFDATSPATLLDRLLAEETETLQQSAAATVLAATAATGMFAEAGERFLIFTLADTNYAIDAGQVLEVGKPPRLTPVPNVPDWVLGLSNVRGDIVSVVDVRQFLGLGLTSPGPHGRMLMVRARGEELTAGLLVDQVRGIRRLLRENFHATNAIDDSRITPYVQGVCEHGGALLVLLDLNRLLLSAEFRQFELV